MIDPVPARLVAAIERFPALAVAVSGGVDSMLLAHVVHDHTPTRLLAVHAASPAVPAVATARVRDHADRFGWDAGTLSQDAMAAVREQDTEKRRVMYETLQKAHTDTSPFLYMFQQVRKVGIRSSVKGLVLGQTFSDDRYWNVTK